MGDTQRLEDAPTGGHRCFVLALAAATIVAVVFVGLFATATPLTDEWAFVQSVMDLEGLDPSDPRWFAQVLDEATLSFNGHVVAVPFLVYWVLAPAVEFDHRWFVALTLVTFLVQIGLYRRWSGRASLALVPIVLVMLSPSHYMEFVWGFEFTLAFSIVLPMVGLAALDRIAAIDPWPARASKLAGGLALVTLGAFSSAGGWFGFAAAVLLLALRPLALRAKLALIVPVLLAGAAVAMIVFPESTEGRTFGRREVFHVLTALGGTIWSSPVGLFEFGPDLRSATGALILTALAASFLHAIRRRALAAIALPLSFAAFSLLCLASIAYGREYLGNWHLQYALPAVCGAHACAYGVWRAAPRSLAAIAPLAALSMVLTASVGGAWRAFEEHGPGYRAYIADIESWALRRLQTIDAEKPVPDGPELGADLLLYLSAHDHPLFTSGAQPRVAREASGGERVFVGERELPRPGFVIGPADRRLRLTVVLPASEPALGVRVDVGEASVRLHRIDPRHGAIEAGDGAACYAGWLLPGRLGEGLQPVRVWLTE